MTPKNRKRGPEPHPWERQSWETETAWAAFECYRDYDCKPSARRAAADCGISVSQAEKWCGKNLWRQRRAVWLAHKQRIKDDEDLLDLRLAHRRHLRNARKMQELGRTRIEEIQASKAQRKDMRARDAGKLISEGVKIDRLSLGEATERVGNELDLTKLSTDELLKLRELTEKARAV